MHLDQRVDTAMSEKRTFEFTDRALKGLPVPPKPQQLDYFDAKARGLGLRISYGGRKSFFAMYSNRAGRRKKPCSPLSTDSLPILRVIQKDLNQRNTA